MRLNNVDHQTQNAIDALTGQESMDEMIRISAAALASESAFNRSNLFRCVHLAASSLGSTPSGINSSKANTLMSIAANIKPTIMGPGPADLVAGDMWSGYFGEVSHEQLFAGDELATELGVDEGELQNSEAGWFKFAWRGQVIYIAKQNFMHSVSWDHLYSRGIVYGTDDNGLYPRGNPTNQHTEVSKDGFGFICQLMTGAQTDPIDTSERNEEYSSTLGLGAGSMWNELMYRVAADIPVSPNGLIADGGAQFGDNWAEFSDADLNFSGNGRFCWQQETASDSTSDRVLRGTDRVSGFGSLTASGTSASRGWRPCLVLKS